MDKVFVWHSNSPMWPSRRIAGIITMVTMEYDSISRINFRIIARSNYPDSLGYFEIDSALDMDSILVKNTLEFQKYIELFLWD